MFSLFNTGMRIRHFFPRIRIRISWEKNPDPTPDSGLYFVQDENNFINPLLQVGSGSVEKTTGSRSGGPKINGSDRIRIRIRILIPAFKYQASTDQLVDTHLAAKLTSYNNFSGSVLRQANFLVIVKAVK